MLMITVGSSLIRVGVTITRVVKIRVRGYGQCLVLGLGYYGSN